LYLEGGLKAKNRKKVEKQLIIPMDIPKKKKNAINIPIYIRTNLYRYYQTSIALMATETLGKGRELFY
jgi:hypothetical protein